MRRRTSAILLNVVGLAARIEPGGSGLDRMYQLPNVSRHCSTTTGTPMRISSTVSGMIFWPAKGGMPGRGVTPSRIGSLPSAVINWA